MKPTKQVIVMRTETAPPMRKGKMIAQGGHGVAAFLTRRIEELMDGVRDYTSYLSENGDFDVLGFIGITPAMWQWMKNDNPKICLRADSEQELLETYEKAKASGLEVHLVTDSGKTEFKEPTVTCCCIGPNYSEDIDKITGHMKLL